MPKMWFRERGDNASEILPVVLRMWQLWEYSSSRKRRLLCILFLRNSSLPSYTRWRAKKMLKRYLEQRHININSVEIPNREEKVIN